MAFDSDGRYQESRPASPIDIERADLSLLGSREQTAAVAEIAKYYGSTPFDLSGGKLIRLKLVKLADDEYVLFFSGHHIVSDGWSTNLILGEICEVYSAAIEKREPDLPEAGSFRDYVELESDDEVRTLAKPSNIGWQSSARCRTRWNCRMTDLVRK